MIISDDVTIEYDSFLVIISLSLPLYGWHTGGIVVVVFSYHPHLLGLVVPLMH